MPEVQSRRRRRPGRKDRLIQTRVARDLESTLKREAQRRRLTVSHLIRNVLEDTFQLVDDVVDGVDGIVSESMSLARRVGRDARRMAGAVREAVAEPAIGERQRDEAEPLGSPADGPEPAAGPDLARVYAWSAVVANHAVECSRCRAPIARGAEAYVGLCEEPRAPRAWLCPSCREAL